MVICQNFKFILSFSKEVKTDNTLDNIVKITGKRNREIGLVVPSKSIYKTKDKHCLAVLKTDLETRNILS